MPDRYGDVDDNVTHLPDREWAAERRRAAAMAIVNCGLCDDDGYRDFRVCDHQDRSEIYRRGLAKVREVLEGRGKQ